jgi:peptide/nickel transport system substrate-binding protein
MTGTSTRQPARRTVAPTIRDRPRPHLNGPDRIHTKVYELFRLPVSRRFRIAAVVAAIAVALAACSGGGGSSDSGSSSKATDTLNLAIPPSALTLDPAQMQPTNSRYVWGSIYESLAYWDPQTGAVTPWAAKGWTYSPDGKTLTIQLRDGLTFSDGSAVQASDVAATINRSVNTSGYIQSVDTAVASAEAPDDKTVLVHFKYYDPKWVSLMGREVGVIAKASNLNSPDIATNPIGSGPYTLDTQASVPGSKYVLRKRKDYWDANSFPFSTINVNIVNDPTAQLNSFKAGQANATIITSQQVSGAKAVEGATVTQVDATTLYWLLFLDKYGKTSNPQFKDVRVRQAVNYALDRDGIAQKLLQGHATPTDQVFFPSRDVFDVNLEKKYPYDPAKAKELLAQAGYPNGFTIEIPSSQATQQFEPTLSQELGAAGITLKWVPIPESQTASIILTGQYQLYLKQSGIVSDPYTAALYFTPDGGTVNPEKYTDPTITSIYDKITTTVDPQQSIQVYKELNNYAVDQALAAPVTMTAALWATSQGVTFVDRAGLPADIRQFGVAGK